MKTEDLKARGVYVLSRDVKNPKPDRRLTRRWTAEPVWKQGMLLICGKYSDGSTLLDGAEAYGSLGPGSDGWSEVMEALEEAPRTFETVMLSLKGSPGSGGWASEILEELVATGMVTLDDVERIGKEIKARA